MSDDLISRQQAIEVLRNRWLKTRNYEGIGEDIAEECEIYLKTLPSVQPERIKGHWIEIALSNHTYKCSVCGRLLANITDGKNNVAKNYPYCHCGADMRATERNSNV